MKINPIVNRPIASNNTPDNMSFKGKGKGFLLTDFVTNTLNNTIHLDKHIAKGVAKLSQTSLSDRLVDMTRKLPNPPARWADFESFAITFFYMWNTWKSDKIDEERKIPSMIQNGAVTIASSLAALAIDEACAPLINKLAEAYKKLPAEKMAELRELTAEEMKKFKAYSPEELIKFSEKSTKEFFDAAGKLKSNTIFTAVVRFIIPVLMVPAVGTIVKKLKEKSAQNNPQPGQQTAQNQQKTNNVANPNKLNTTQGYAPKISFDQTENKFKSLFA